jgi:membrane associated rhomboid family serine protease
MRTPPSPVKCLHYPVTTCLVMLAIVATLRAWGGDDIDCYRSEFGDCIREPWRLLTPVLFHGGILHLFFDVCWLWVFGTLLESEFGHIAVLGIYFLLAACTTAAELAIFRGGIGLSGIVYGLFGLLWVLSATVPRFHDAVDHKLIELMTSWFILCIVLTVAEVWHIALAAHAAGCVFGALLGWAIIAPRPGSRLWRSTVVAAVFLLCIAGGTVARPLGETGIAEAEQGDAALAGGNLEQAIVWYELAVKANPDVHAWWTKLSQAYLQIGKREDARWALNHATELRGPRSRLP